MTEIERLEMQRRQQEEELEQQARQRAAIQAEQERQRQEKLRLEEKVRQEESRLAREREAIRRQQEENERLKAQTRGGTNCKNCGRPLITVSGNNTTILADFSFAGPHVVLGCSNCKHSNRLTPAELSIATGGSITVGWLQIPSTDWCSKMYTILIIDSWLFSTNFYDIKLCIFSFSFQKSQICWLCMTFSTAGTKMFLGPKKSVWSLLWKQE